MQSDEAKQTHELIGELLKRKNPALVGIRKILHSKSGNLSPEKSFGIHVPEVFSVETEVKSLENETIFTDNEIKSLEFEKKILELEEVIKQKEQKIQIVKEEAFEEGRIEGIAENQETAKTVIYEAVEKMKVEIQQRLAQQITQELSDRKKYFLSLEEDVYSMISAVVKKILVGEIQTNPYLIINTIKQSLSHISQRDGITIRVSNEESEYVKQRISDFNRHNDGIYAIDIIADEHIEVGGCLIETNSTIVDAQIEKRTDKIFQLVENIWNETKNGDISKEISFTEETKDDSDEQENLCS
jgi:flagellar biosynthesis/type III secretory pathway protein FliH